MSAVLEADTLKLTRIFDAAPQAVFDAWADSGQLGAWMGPGEVRCEVTQHEFKTAGAYRFVMHLPDGSEMQVGGVFKKIDPPNCLQFTWRWESGENDSLVTVLFRGVGSKTEMTLIHEGLPTAESRENHNKGWVGCLDKLAARLAAKAA